MKNQCKYKDKCSLKKDDVYWNKNCNKCLQLEFLSKVVNMETDKKVYIAKGDTQNDAVRTIKLMGGW